MSTKRNSASTFPSVAIAENVRIPQLGYGVFQIPSEQTEGCVETAIGLGYRHIDTAAAYNNEAGVGRAVAGSGVPREELFITTKLRNGEQGAKSAEAAFMASMDRLGLEYVDLYLIHWPSPARDAYIESWRALERLLNQGAVRAIGVSNFLPHHLQRLVDETGVVPAVNQIEVHPRFQQRSVREACERLGIAVEAYSPLGQGRELHHPLVHQVAEAHGVTPAQALLRWHLQQGLIVIAKSATPTRMAENLDILGFELTDEQMHELDALECGDRIGGNPDTFEISQIR